MHPASRIRKAPAPPSLGILAETEAITIPAVAGLCLVAAAFVPAWASLAARPLVMAQGGFTFGPRDDHYSERSGRPVPADPRVCRWVAVRTVNPMAGRWCGASGSAGSRVPARE